MRRSTPLMSCASNCNRGLWAHTLQLTEWSLYSEVCIVCCSRMLGVNVSLTLAFHFWWFIYASKRSVHLWKFSCCTKLGSIINLCLPRYLSSAIIQNPIQKTPSGFLQREPGQRQLSGKPRKIHHTRSTFYLSVFQYPSSSIYCTSAVVYWRTTKDKEKKMIRAYLFVRVCSHWHQDIV